MRTVTTTAFKPTTRINRHMGILLGFVLLSSLCFASFAYDTSKLADLQARTKSATYISVLAILRNHELPSRDKELLAVKIVEIFTDRPGNKTKIIQDDKQLLVSANVSYKPFIVQLFGMSSMLARSKSAGRLSLSQSAVNSELNRVLLNLKDSKYFPALVRLLLKTEQKKLRKQTDRQTAKNNGLIRQQKKLKIHETARAPITIAAKPSTTIQLSIRPSIINTRKPDKTEISTKKQSGTASKTSNVNSRSRDSKAIEKLTSNSFDELLDSRKTGPRHKSGKSITELEQLLKNSKDYALKTGSDSGFNLIKMLIENRNRPAVAKKSTFSWSALWKYMHNSYSPEDKNAKIQKDKSSAPPSSSVFIEFSLLIIVLSNIVLWLLTFLKYRMNKKLSRKEAIHSRIHELTFN